MSRSTWHKILTTFGLIIVYFLFRNVEFKNVDYFHRDLLQFLNINKNIDPRIATLTINLDGNKVKHPHSVETIQQTIDELEKQKPIAIILIMEPLDFDFSPEKKEALYKYLSNKKTLYLNKNESRDNTNKFENDPLFKKFPRLITFLRAKDSTAGKESRRAVLLIESIGYDPLPSELNKIGIKTVPFDQFEYSYQYWNSTQVYIKYYPLGTYGNYQSLDLHSGKLNNIFSNKLVIVGTSDHFSYMNSRSTFNLLGAAIDNDYNKTRIPVSDVFANLVNFYITGDYIKYLKNADGLLFTVLILILIVVSRLTTKTKIFLFYGLIPIFYLFSAVIYVFGSFYIDFSRATAVLIGLQYLAAPIIFLNYYLKNEKQKQIAVENTRIEMLTQISEQMAHDIKSPLSTISLLASKANFENSDAKILLTNSITRIRNILDSLLTDERYKNLNRKINLEKTDLTKIVNLILFEKINIYSNINFENTLPNKSVNIFADAVELERVISNILDNAANAVENTDSKVITISCSINKNTVDLKISDSGIGMPKEIQNKIGKARVTTKSDKNSRGIGLLNAIAVLNQMNGSLSIKSELNIGTVIIISLQRA